MDVVGSILNCMTALPTVPSEKTKQLQCQKKTDVQNFKGMLQNFSEKEVYKCDCDINYVDKKEYNSHQNLHKNTLNSDDKIEKSLTNGTNEPSPNKLGLNIDTLFPPIDDDIKKKFIQQAEVFDNQPSPISDSYQKKLNPPEKKSSYCCDLCKRIFSNRQKFVNHKKNHKRNKISGERKQLYLERKKNPSIHPIHNNKLTANEHMQVPIEQLSSTSDSHRKKLNPPEKKSSYNCDICGRIFSKKKTYENHKTNHNLNRNTSKHLFFERGKKKKNPHDSN